MLFSDERAVQLGRPPDPHRVDVGQRSDLSVEVGILVDGRLQTSRPAIFAAGDVGRHRHPMLGPLRIEHWANALDQGPAAARNMFGGVAPYDRVPDFFSDQYEVGMEYRGLARRCDQVVPAVTRRAASSAPSAP